MDHARPGAGRVRDLCRNELLNSYDLKSLRVLLQKNRGHVCRLASLLFDDFDGPSWRNDGDALEGLEGEQIVIAGDDELGAGGER